MPKSLALVATLLLSSLSIASAQITFVTPSNRQAHAPRAPRARGPALDLAVEAAQTAVAACEAKGYKVSAVIVDSAAVPVVILSGDGAAAITQLIALGKAVSSVKIGIPSGKIARQVKADRALAARLAADPEMGPQRPGGLPIKIGPEIIGAIAVSGTPNGIIDQSCARAGLDKVRKRLK